MTTIKIYVRIENSGGKQKINEKIANESTAYEKYYIVFCQCQSIVY